MSCASTVCGTTVLLSLATFTTLLVVPVVYSYLRKGVPVDYEEGVEA